MIGKTLQNNNFRETISYVLDKEKAKILGSTVMGRDSDTISREFELSRSLNPDIERAVYHLINSYSYLDSATQNLTDEFRLERAKERFAGLVVSAREPELLRRDDKTEYKQKVQDFLETEIYEYQWVCASHGDTKHTHDHFVASRMNLVTGRCIPTWQDKERSHRICREMEKDYGLQQLQSYYEIERRSPTRGQLEEWEKTGIPPVMVQLQDAINQELESGHDLIQVRSALQEKHGIQSELVERKGGLGVVFSKADAKVETVYMSGLQLGRGYTLPAIERRLEKNMELQPPQVEPGQEEEVELDPLQEVLNQQKEYLGRITPQLKEIFENFREGRPQLKTATFEDYQIRLGDEGEPELYRRDRQLIEYSESEYRSRGLTEEDCTKIDRFNELAQQQAQERQQQLELQQRETHMQKEALKEKTKQVEKSRGFEL